MSREIRGHIVTTEDRHRPEPPNTRYLTFALSSEDWQMVWAAGDRTILVVPEGPPEPRLIRPGVALPPKPAHPPREWK